MSTDLHPLIGSTLAALAHIKEDAFQIERCLTATPAIRKRALSIQENCRTLSDIARNTLCDPTEGTHATEN